MRAIDADALYKKVQHDEELARNRVLDTESTLPYPNNLNPSYTRYAAQLDERTRLKDMIADAPTIEPERKKGKWIERNPQNSDKCRLIECDQCGFAHIVGFNVPYEHWIENRNFCERCGSDMRGNHND